LFTSLFREDDLVKIQFVLKAFMMMQQFGPGYQGAEHDILVGRLREYEQTDFW
jgi:hypothetical protein